MSTTKIAFLLAAAVMVFSITIAAPSVYAADLTNAQRGQNNTHVEAGGEIQMDENVLGNSNTNTREGGTAFTP